MQDHRVKYRVFPLVDGQREIQALIRATTYFDLCRANGEWLELADDPEVWSEADWLEFERDREAFERHFGETEGERSRS